MNLIVAILALIVLLCMAIVSMVSYQLGYMDGWDTGMKESPHTITEDGGKQR